MKIKNVALGAFALALGLIGAPAHAQQQAPATDQDIPEPPESDEAEEGEGAPAAAEKEDATAAGGSAKIDFSANATGATAGAEADGAAAAAEPQGTPTRARVYGKESDWTVTPYGYARFDGIWDSTQSFEDGYNPYLIARAGTYKGDHHRATFTARDSRIGLFVGAPEFEGMRSYAQIELDFFGLVPTDAKKHDATVYGPVRLRHAYFKLETSVVDLLAGQYWDLFGWGSHYFPATVGYLGVPGQVYHRDPQLRLEKAIDVGQLEIKPAIAAVRPGQRDSGIPDAQAGVKFAFDGWTGAAMSGMGNSGISPLSLGVSGVYRRFEVPYFKQEPGSEALTKDGYGIHVGALLPVIPADDPKERANALTLTGEFSTGTGIADMYTNMDGGARLPVLPNPQAIIPALPYAANVDPGLVTFDSNFHVQTIDWQGFVVGLQYYLPIDSGRVWLAGIYSQVKSDNIKELTPYPNHGGIFTKMEYIDASVGVDITPSILLGFSFQTLKQTFGDVRPPTPIYGELAPPMGPLGSPSVAGTGGESVTARNNRFQLSSMFIF